MQLIKEITIEFTNKITLATFVTIVDRVQEQLPQNSVGPIMNYNRRAIEVMVAESDEPRTLMERVMSITMYAIENEQERERGLQE